MDNAIDSGRPRIEEVYNALNNALNYWLEFSQKVNRGTRVSDLLEAEKEIQGIAEQCKTLLPNIQELDERMGAQQLYPSNLLQRIVELADSVAISAKSAAKLISSGAPANRPVLQMKNTLPTLIKLTRQAVTWADGLRR